MGICMHPNIDAWPAFALSFLPICSLLFREREKLTFSSSSGSHLAASRPRKKSSGTLITRNDEMNIEGFQFTMNFNQNSLSFVEMIPAIAQKENFGFTLLQEGAITSSWNGNGAAGNVFSLSFVANEDGQLSDLLNINSLFILVNRLRLKAFVMPAASLYAGRTMSFDLISLIKAFS